MFRSVIWEFGGDLEREFGRDPEEDRRDRGLMFGSSRQSIRGKRYESESCFQLYRQSYVMASSHRVVVCSPCAEFIVHTVQRSSGVYIEYELRPLYDHCRAVTGSWDGVNSTNKHDRRQICYCELQCRLG